MAFAYALRQRVTVPGQDAVQGVITRRTESIGEPNNYRVRWVSASGREQAGWFSEDELDGSNHLKPDVAAKKKARRA